MPVSFKYDTNYNFVNILLVQTQSIGELSNILLES